MYTNFTQNEKKLIALTFGFLFLIAGFGVSYDFEYNEFDFSTFGVQAEEPPVWEYVGRITEDGRCVKSLFNRNCYIGG